MKSKIAKLSPSSVQVQLRTKIKIQSQLELSLAQLSPSLSYFKINSDNVPADLWELLLTYPSTALSYPTQLFYIMCTRYAGAVLQIGNKYHKSELIKIILSLNHVYGGYCL